LVEPKSIQIREGSAGWGCEPVAGKTPVDVLHPPKRWTIALGMEPLIRRFILKIFPRVATGAG
jgi:hypothetical protein